MLEIFIIEVILRAPHTYYLYSIGRAVINVFQMLMFSKINKLSKTCCVEILKTITLDAILLIDLFDFTSNVEGEESSGYLFINALLKYLGCCVNRIDRSIGISWKISCCFENYCFPRSFKILMNYWWVINSSYLLQVRSLAEKKTLCFLYYGFKTLRGANISRL